MDGLHGNYKGRLQMEELIAIFKALSDETRLRILKILENGELCVCDICNALAIIQPKASFHLHVLKSAKLIKDRKQGKWMHYCISDDDMFKRFLVLSISDRIQGNIAEQDKQRLKNSLKQRGTTRC